MDRIRNEPAVLAGIVAALIGVAVAFGLDLSTEQQAAIMGLVTIVLGVGVRTQVVPTRTLPPDKP